MHLLPQPQSIQLTGGRVALGEIISMHAPADLAPPEARAVAELQALWLGRVGRPLRRFTGDESSASEGLVIRLDSNESAGGAAERYRLQVGPKLIELSAPTGSGVLHGLRTLRQMLLADAETWPCGQIDDWPDFAVRGLSFDVSRGRVPTLATLKELVDTLAGLKANLLQLYVEHTFAFQFDSEIGRGCSPFTADDLRALDAYCVQRRVQLVPCIASFGHMGFILSLPRYRHLAEIEAVKPWETMTWRERMHGLTLDPCNPESRALLERMHGELLPLFSAPCVNVSGDETYDLGRGKNRARAERDGIGRLYVEHLQRLHGLCARYGKRMLFWGDIIKKYPELIGEIPRDAVVLNWGYAPDADYESTALFRNAGLETWVCPGTASWNRVINDIGAAELNVRRYADAGRGYGAAGLMNTDWGDEGHFNMLATSWHPIMLGAAMAWNASAPDVDGFDSAFSALHLGDESGKGLDTLRRILRSSSVLRSWPLLAAPIDETRSAAAEMDERRLEEWRASSVEAADWFDAHARVRAESVQDAREIAVACRANALLAEKLQLARGDKSSGITWEGFARGCETLAQEYERVWLARSRPERLHEILAVFERLAAEARSK